MQLFDMLWMWFTSYRWFRRMWGGIWYRYCPHYTGWYRITWDLDNILTPKTYEAENDWIVYFDPKAKQSYVFEYYGSEKSKAQVYKAEFDQVKTKREAERQKYLDAIWNESERQRANPESWATSNMEQGTRPSMVGIRPIKD